MLGYSMNTRDMDALNEAKDKLIEQKKAGIVKAYQVDETKDKMIAGEAAMGLMWSGDAAYAMSFNDDLAYVVRKKVPTSGWTVCASPRAQRTTKTRLSLSISSAAPEIALMNFEEICYCTPNSGAIELIDDPEVLADETLFPSDETIARCEFFHDISQDIQTYNRIWLAVKSAR